VAESARRGEDLSITTGAGAEGVGDRGPVVAGQQIPDTYRASLQIWTVVTASFWAE
jgi:hypothetical protein